MLNKIQKTEVLSGLLQLGLATKEVTVYLSILENSEATIPSISKDTLLSRGTVYDIVEKLKTKGFVAEIKKGKKRRLVAENPTSKLYAILDEKHHELQKSKKIVEDILPTINAVYPSDAFKPQIRVYEGEKGFRKVWDEIFDCADKNFLVIAKIETFEEFAGKELFAEILEKKNRLGFFSRAINESSQSSREIAQREIIPNREIRLAPEEFQFPSTEIIFGNKIAMFTTQKENTIVVIESKNLAQSHRTYFEMLWKSLEI